MAFLLFFTALVLSGIAAYYSVIGLTAIFAAAAIPVAIMGISLEVAKLVVASWLYRFWKNIPILLRVYFTTALVVLMLITSMGIFGYLSKAHLDQSLVSGDVVAKISVYDEKIKTAQDNIDVNRKALKQLDEAVDQVMGRSTSETGADKAVAIRKSQAKERTRLFAEITAEQKTITALREERAPIAAEVRKVEAEVGPIKYIAALVYGDNAESGALEKAVRGLIIMLVFVFDPLAVLMLIAANLTQLRQKEEEKADEFLLHKTVPVSASDVVPQPADTPAYEKDDGPLTDDQVQQIKDEVEENSLNWKLETTTTTTAEPTTTEPANYKIIPEEAVIPVAFEDVTPEVIEAPEETIDDDKMIVINEDLTVDKNVEQQVETMIENNDQDGLEAVYKKIVKELAKQNRKKSTHWNSK